MIIIGKEVFEMCKLIIETRHDLLQDHPLFQTFCDYTARDECLTMSLTDIFPTSDWRILSFEGFDCNRVNDIMVFQNITDLFRGLHDLYLHVQNVLDVKYRLDLVEKCLRKIEGRLDQDAMMEELSSLRF